MSHHAELPVMGEPIREWRKCRNVRDLGGLPAHGGGLTRRDALIRADTLDRLSDHGITQVKDAGVARIVDLRSPGEASGVMHPFHADSTYQMVPFIDERRDHERDPAAEHTLADLYRGSVDRNARRIAAAVTAIATAPEGAVVVHCASGKDRTGMLVALVLDVMGVPRSLIADDYAVSERCLGVTPGSTGTASPTTATAASVTTSPRITTTASVTTSPGHDNSVDPQPRKEWMSRAHPSTILETLEHVDRRHGGVHAYLSAGGVSPTQLDELRSRLVVTPR
jgi:protein-tyrosine phosphatase